MRVRNDTGLTKTWAGQQLTNGQEYDIEANELNKWRTNDVVIQDISSLDLAVGDGATYQATSAAAISFFLGHVVDAQVQNQPAFADKTASNGMKLYRRVHGVKATLSGDTFVSLVIPYDYCKINALEVLWAPAGLTVDLKVYDTPTGTISGTNNLLLNQFGFGAGVAKDLYSDESQYDADLIKDMKVEVKLINPSSHTDEVCVNFILHEMKT
jgi:hypothetical protein